MLHLTVGSGNSGKGGDAKVLAGAVSAETGGSLTLGWALRRCIGRCVGRGIGRGIGRSLFSVQSFVQNLHFMFLLFI
jgi:hypothetical protein